MSLSEYDFLKNGTDAGIDVRCSECGRAWWKIDSPCHRPDCSLYGSAAPEESASLMTTALRHR
jgi:hypothetical protein